MCMATNIRIAAWPSDGAAPRADALSDVYRYVLECRAKRKTTESAPESKSYKTAGESKRSFAGTPLKESTP